MTQRFRLGPNVKANVKRHARLNIISHLLSLIPYEDLTPEALELPPRQDAGEYSHPDFSYLNFLWLVISK